MGGQQDLATSESNSSHQTGRIISSSFFHFDVHGCLSFHIDDSEAIIGLRNFNIIWCKFNPIMRRSLGQRSYHLITIYDPLPVKVPTHFLGISLLIYPTMERVHRKEKGKGKNVRFFFQLFHSIARCAVIGDYLASYSQAQRQQYFQVRLPDVNSTKGRNISLE